MKDRFSDEQLMQVWITLTPTERQVARLLREGRGVAEIAALLCVSPATIRTHVQHLLRKFELHRRQDLARTLLRMPASLFEAHG